MHYDFIIVEVLQKVKFYYKNLIIMLIKYSISMDEAFSQVFDNEENLKEYLSYAFEQYIEDGNFNIFYRALELAIKS